MWQVSITRYGRGGDDASKLAFQVRQLGPSAPTPLHTHAGIFARRVFAARFLFPGIDSNARNPCGRIR